MSAIKWQEGRMGTGVRAVPLPLQKKQEERGGEKGTVHRGAEEDQGKERTSHLHS